MTRLHICGNTTPILDDMAQSGADIIDLDWMVDMEQAHKIIGDRAVICGNQDPVAVMLNGTAELVEAEVTKAVKAGGPRCINMAGCEIPDGTPIENLETQRRVLNDLARQGF